MRIASTALGTIKFSVMFPHMLEHQIGPRSRSRSASKGTIGSSSSSKGRSSTGSKARK